MQRGVQRGRGMGWLARCIGCSAVLDWQVLISDVREAADAILMPPRNQGKNVAALLTRCRMMG